MTTARSKADNDLRDRRAPRLSARKNPPQLRCGGLSISRSHFVFGSALDTERITKGPRSSCGRLLSDFATNRRLFWSSLECCFTVPCATDAPLKLSAMIDSSAIPINESFLSDEQAICWARGEK